MTSRRVVIALQVEPRFAAAVSERTLITLAKRVLASEQIDAPAELSIVVTDDDTLRELNLRYRHQDAPTDVLSFRMEQGGFVTPPEGPQQLGEVLISHPTAARQAKEAGRDLADELAHLLTHGILHLLGYEHESADDERVMRSREEMLLGTSTLH